MPFYFGSRRAMLSGARSKFPANQFLLDTFTDPDTTVIGSHTGEQGATWSLQFGYNPATPAQIFNNALYPTAISSAYRASGVPATRAYRVDTILDFKTAISGDSQGPSGRMDFNANTMYFARWNQAAAGYQLFKLVAGTPTQLGSTVAQAFPTGEHMLSLIMTSNDRISMLVDDALVIGPIDDSAAPITGIGFAGMRMGVAATTTTGMHIKAISAYNL